MNVIIVGCGRVGRTLAEKLNADGNDVTVVDMSAEKVRVITNRCDVLGIVGNGATHTVQREAGIENADLFIAVTNSDELNLLCCMIAKKEGHCQTVARVKNPQYSTEKDYLKKELGLAMVINPEYAAAEEIARVLRFPAAIKIEPFAMGKVELVKFKLPAGCPLVGMSVKDAVIKYRLDMLVCTIERGEELLVVNGDSVFEEKDLISIVATPKNAVDFFDKIGHKGNSIKDAMIVGGGSITHYLCDILQNSKMAIKIIEKDYSVCEELCSKWQKANVIHGNPADKELLKEEGVEKAGAFVTLTDFDEENILLSLYAKEEGEGKLITKINRTDYDSVINRLDLDTVICPKNITADSIVRYVRSIQNTMGSNIEAMYDVGQGQGEISEFIVKENSSITDTPLCQLSFKKNILIAAISRGEEVILPRGQDVIKAGDSVIVLSKDMALWDIADVLR